MLRKKPNLSHFHLTTQIGLVFILFFCCCTLAKAQLTDTAPILIRWPDGGAATDTMRLCSAISGLAAANYIVDEHNHIKWQKDGQDIALANGNVFYPTENGSYRAIVYSDTDNTELATDEVEVILDADPSFTFNYPDSIGICEGATYEFEVEGDPNYQYQWYRNGAAIYGATSQSYTASEAGEYHVGVSACSGTVLYSDRVYLELISLYPPSSPDGGTFCYGSTISLTLSNYSGREDLRWYLNDEWIPGENSVNILLDQPGSYRVSLSYKGCTVMSEPYIFAYDPPLEVTLEKSTLSTLCPSESLEITSAVSGNLNGLQYLWSTGANTPSITVNNGGIYQLTVTNARGCSAVAEMEVAVFPDLPSFTLPDTVICLMEEEKVRIEAPTGFVSYRWNGQESLQHWMEIDAPGYYELLVTDSNGCTAVHTFNVRPYCDNILIPNIFSPNGDGINDTWNILGLEGETDAHIRIFSRSGQLIIDTWNVSPAWDGTVNGSPAPEGAYYYIIERPQEKQQLKGSLTLIR